MSATPQPGERYKLITFGPPWGELESACLFDDEYPFLMDDDDGAMSLFSTQTHSSDESDESIQAELVEREWHPKLVALLIYARSQGFDYLIIDRDCEEALPDPLPTADTATQGGAK